MATDPSDWSFRPLRDLDALLRCPICFEYYSTAVMLPQCSHNYCSLCIRRFLVHKQLCPSCNEPATEADLKGNRLLDELVMSFTKSRSDFMALAQLSMLENKDKRGAPSRQVEEQVPCANAKNLINQGARQNSKQRERKVSMKDRASERSLTVAAQKQTSITAGQSARVNGREPNLEIDFSEDTFCVPKPPSLCNSEFEFSEFTCRDISATPPLSASSRQPGRSSSPPVLPPTTTPTSGAKPRKRMLQFEEEPVAKMSADSKVEVSMEEEGIVPVEEDDSVGDGDWTPPLSGHKREGKVGVAKGYQEKKDTGETNSTNNNDVVECPVCGKKVKVLLINSHLDRCLSEPFLSVSPPASPPSSRLLPPPSSSSQAPPPPKLAGIPIEYKQGKPLPRLPKLVFSIMKDRELKKKLKEYQLPTHGQRKALITRLEEFTLQYKAQQDSLHPKTVKEIAQAVEKAEKEKEAARKPAPLNTTVAAVSTSRRTTTSCEADEAAVKAYEQQHAAHFAELIAGMRKRQAKKSSAGMSSQAQDEGQGSSKVEGQGSSKAGGLGSVMVEAEDPECNNSAGVLAGESPDEVADQEWWDKDEEEEQEESLMEEVEESQAKRHNTTNTIPESPGISSQATPIKTGSSSTINQVTPSRSPFKFRYLGSPSFPFTPSPTSSKQSHPSPSLLQHQRADSGLVGRAQKRSRLEGRWDSDSECQPDGETASHQETMPRMGTRRSLRRAKK